jgi:hypothetical protein
MGFLLAAIISPAQQANYTLSSSTSGVYKARDYVRLLPGFHSVASSGTFVAAIDPSIIAGGSTVVSTPLAATSNHNYIVTTVAAKAVADASSLDDNNSNTTIQYFDGLGRLEQTVQKAITPQGNDLVSGVVYDDFGRESQKWLPGMQPSNGGAYVTGYASLAQGDINGRDDHPYATTNHEASPLNRPTEQYGPGADWYSNTKRKKIEYTTNGSDIKLFYVENDQLKYDRNYDAATLYGQKITDEDQKTVEEFTDKQGRKVLSRVAGDHDTYYVYDDLDNLRYVLPPLASDGINSTADCGETTGTKLALYGYIYHYDGRKRCIGKKLPGCDWIYMAYDMSDRLVFSQDGNQRTNNKWTMLTYDIFGRLLYTQEVIYSGDKNLLVGAYSDKLVTDTYSSSASGTVPNVGYAIGNDIMFHYAGPSGGVEGTGIISFARLLTVNYYDDYRFLSYTGNNPDGKLAYEAKDGYSAAFNPLVGNLEGCKTLLTGTRVYHLDDPNKFEVTALYYDKYGHTVQTRATNHMEGYDISYNDLDFTGKPNKTLKTHGINSTTPSVTEIYTYTYDQAQRLIETRHSLNGGASTSLALNSYDNLGRVQTKTIGGVDATTYAYNVRSWVTGISGNRFAENLYYNNNTANLPIFTASYNGNIAGMQWSIPSEGLGYSRAYTFGYDQLNRLTDGKYCGFTGGSAVSGTSGRYDETYTYDKMGNITNFVRSGLQSTTPGLVYSTIDDLKLDHTGNQLTKVTENSYGKYLSDNIYYGDEEFVPNLANTGNSCIYDANGNRLYDSNSNIWKINYNVLNLPDAMQFYQKHQTFYTYSASGTKLKVVDKTAVDGPPLPVSNLNSMPSDITFSSTTTTDYVGNYIYENGSLKRILLPEGYWQNGAYYYYLKDHLGSNRIVMKSDGSVAESSSFYPSGMRFGESVVSGGNVQPYRHTGHEMQGMHGLNWIDNLARFRTVSDGGGLPTVDPLAEKYYSISPYVYCAGNPIYYIDPDGMKVVDNGNSYTITGDDIYNYFGYMKEINKGTGSMNNLQESLQNASEKNSKKGGNMSSTLNEASVVGQKNPETLKQMPHAEAFEFWMEEKSDNFFGKAARTIVSMAYSVINSPSITFTGRTFAGFPVDNCNDRIMPLVDCVTAGLGAGGTKLLPLLKTEGGISGFNSFLKANKGLFTGKGWQKEASKAFQLNQRVATSIDYFNDGTKIIGVADETSKH